MKYLLGVDIGTTSLKACVFDENGVEYKSATKSYTLITEGERVEFPAEKYFELFMEAYNELTKEYKIHALAIDTQGETMICVDKAGKPVMNAIVWLDNRAGAEAKLIEDKFGLKTVYEVTGQTEVPAGYPAPKILWLKNNMPEVFNKTDKFLMLEDWLLYKLTGKFVAEKSLYSSTLYLDARTGVYYKDMLDFIGITEDRLPKLYESGELVGEYNGAKVVTGALDQISGFIGSGIIREGLVSEMTGTALAVCALSTAIPPYFEGIKVPAYYVGKNKYCLLMWAPTAGMVLEWFKKNFCFDIGFKEIDEQAEKIELGSEGLVVAPNMRGSVMPENDSELKGGVYGIDLKHTRAHFSRAIMESIACMLRQYLEYLGIKVDKIISIGGGSKSKLWRQIKADITGKTVVTLKNKETGCLGTAIYAGYGAGLYKDINDAVTSIVQEDTETPSKADKVAADGVYNRYLAYGDLLLKRENL